MEFSALFPSAFLQLRHERMWADALFRDCSDLLAFQVQRLT